LELNLWGYWWCRSSAKSTQSSQHPFDALPPSLPPTLCWNHFYVRVFCTWLWSQGSVEHKQSTWLTQNPPLFFWARQWCWGFTKSAWSASHTHFPLIPQLFWSIWRWSWDPKLIRFHFQWCKFSVHCSQPNEETLGPPGCNMLSPLVKGEKENLCLKLFITIFGLG